MAENPENIPGTSDQHAQVPECILHTGTKLEQGDIKHFDAKTWETVRNIAKLRKKRYKISKYTPICERVSSLEVNDAHGYHIGCYRKFTAIPKVCDETETAPKPTDPAAYQSPLLRSKTSAPTLNTSTAGIFQSVCIFCNVARKSRHSCAKEELGSCESYDAEYKIKHAASVLQDEHMLLKIGQIDFVAKEVKYHHSCRKAYLNEAERQEETRAHSTQSQLRDLHDKSFQELCNHVKESIIQNGCAELLSSLHSKYSGILANNGEYDSPYSSQKLCDKLLSHFDGELCTNRQSNKGTVVYSKHIALNEAINQAFYSLSSTEAVMVDAALKLRTLILQLQKNPRTLPESLTAETVCEGEADAPDELLLFFRTLYTGSSGTSSLSERAERYIQSSADDAVFAATRGMLKPAKHLTLALGLKSLTGSRKVITILNHFGHCVSYHVAESLETDLASTVVEKKNVTPDGILQKPGLSTATAWDNFDENSETLSGKGTLHDTVGICYQNVPETETEPIIVKDIEQPTTQGQQTKRKRRFEVEVTDLAPYPKKPRISTFNYTVKQMEEPANMKQVKRRDAAWAMSCALFVDRPMWSGWNSLISDDKLPAQVLSYMENLHLPPTRLDVVAETMKRSQAVARECGDEYTVVTYDLAIAKPALQIQDQEAPMYKEIFICFGAFHIMMAYFAALGHILDESGGPHILVDTDVLAAGSLRGFLAGKHFNRCKRLHPMLASAFQILHFRSFVEQHGPMSNALREQLHTLQSVTDMEFLENSAEFIALMDNYEEFTEKTRSGDMGATAQYWILYIDLVQVFLRFSRACRTNDLQLYTFCIGQMRGLLFATNHPNYGRYMVRFYLNLLNVDETHPGVRRILENGGLSIRRSSKSFARNPVDMTLEQTVNEDAASRLTGITAFSQSMSTRRKWMVTRSIRSAIVGSLLCKAGLTKPDDTSQELKLYRIQRDNRDLQKLVTGIEDTLNPFGEAANDQKLYCITTGKAVPEDIKTDLLQCVNKGQKWCDEFANGCFGDPDRFERPIPRRKVKNFAKAALKVKISVKDMKLKEIQGTRDLFGRLLFLALSEKVDLQEVFRFPLTPVPMALAHVDGTAMKSDKSKLLRKLEGKVCSNPPPSVDVCVVDGMFTIQSLQNVPPTYGGVAKSILTSLCSRAKRVDFVCDTYKTPSIKDIERGIRGNVGGGINIAVHGPEQHRPKDFNQALRSSDFKTSLLQFFATEWMDDSYATVLNGHQIYYAFGTDCFLYEEENGHVTRKKIDQLTCNHEEADTRIVWHIEHITREMGGSNIVVRCNDTDVLVILLYHVGKLNQLIWMDVGLSGKNTRRYINVTALASKLGNSLCAALPALHCFSGCDFTASFQRKGKLKPLELVEKSKKYQEAFANLGSGEATVDDEVSRTIEAYVCVLYGKPKCSSVNEVRHKIFCEKYKPNDENQPLQNIKSCNASLLPPCQSVLKQKVLRTNYVAGIWKNAHKANPTTLSPAGNGWKIEENKFTFVWFEGAQIPQNICSRIAPVDEDDDDDESDDEGDFNDPRDTSSDESDNDYD